MADNKDKKVLKSSIEREQSQTCLNSAEREKIKGSTNLNVPHLRFPEFRGEWEETTLGKISEITKGSGISKDQLSEQGSPCILYGELYTKYKSEIIGEVYSRTELDSSSLVKSKANDVIIPCSGETAIDISTARCVPFNNILLGGDLNIIRLKNDDGGFFAYQLNGVRKTDIARVAQGVSVVHLYGENLKQITVYHPAIEEQKKITRLLSLIDERIATQNKIIEKLESLIKGIYDKILWQGYKQTSLSEIFDERNERTTINNQYQVLSSTAKGLYRQSDYFDKEVASVNNIGYKVLRLGDIVLSPQNLWLGNINYNDAFEIGIVSPSYKVFSIREDYNPYFVSCFLKTPKALYEYANASEQGASIVRRNLDINAFMAICFPMPERIIQDKVSERLRAINMKFDIEKQILEKLYIEKQYLLRQMFI